MCICCNIYPKLYDVCITIIIIIILIIIYIYIHMNIWFPTELPKKNVNPQQHLLAILSLQLTLAHNC